MKKLKADLVILLPGKLIKSMRINNLDVKNDEIIRYLIVGILTTVVSLGVYFICVQTVLNPYNPIELQIANMFSWLGAVTFAYITNRTYVFKSHNKSIHKEAFSFYLSRAGTLIIEAFCLFAMVSLMGMNDKISKIVVQFIVTVSNYVISKCFIFKKS